MKEMTNRSSSSFADTLAQLTAPPANDKPGNTASRLPSWTATLAMLEDLRCLLLMTPEPGDARHLLTRVSETFDEQLQTCTQGADNPSHKPVSTDDFLVLLPEIKRALDEDTDTAVQSDPAVTSHEEVILCYPGLRALVYYRIARALYSLGVPLMPRLMSEIAHSVTGIDIHPGAQIGRRFFIDHGTGVVIGATCVIGNDVKVYQGVTLGARSFPRSDDGEIIKGIDRHPIIGDRVTIYSGATILGRVHIGSGSVIGGNVWITRDLPANSQVLQRRPRQDGVINGDSK